jgi:large subunit ribosomal protein L18
MLNVASKNGTRKRIHSRIRRRVAGRPQTPRLNVYRSLGHIYAHVIDDSRGATLASASTVDKEVRKTLKSGGNVAAAKSVGKIVAERAKQAGVTQVVFDRGGYAYHGRIKALADAAREAGLKF